MEEKTVSQKYFFKGRILNLRVDEIEFPNGKRAEREVAEHCDGVAVLPVTDDGRVVLVRQFRYPFMCDILEAPAGKVDAGEEHFSCAERELSEETGYSAECMRYLGFIYPSPGCLTERIHLYLATGLTKGESHPDEDEFLDICEMSFEDALKMCDEGKLGDAKTVALLYRAARLFE